MHTRAAGYAVEDLEQAALGDSLEEREARAVEAGPTHGLPLGPRPSCASKTSSLPTENRVTGRMYVSTKYRDRSLTGT